MVLLPSPLVIPWISEPGDSLGDGHEWLRQRRREKIVKNVRLGMELLD
jgi:hypothetical protein